MKVDRGIPTLPPADTYDPVIAAYERDIDETLLIENLKLTPAERGEKFKRFMELCFELRKAGKRNDGPTRTLKYAHPTLG